MRFALYFLSLILAALLVCICCAYFLDWNWCKEIWESAKARGVSLAECLYIIYSVFFLTAIMHFWCRYEKSQFMARIQDRSYVESLMVNAKHALEKISEKLPEQPPSDAGKKSEIGTEEYRRNKVSVQELPQVIQKLKNKLKTDQPIVEYDLLALKVLLVDCADEYAVPAQAHMYMTDLKDYADEEAHTQTVEEYWNIRHRVEDSEKNIYAKRYYESKLKKSSCRNSEEEQDPSLEKAEEEKKLAVRELREIVKEELLPTLTENDKRWMEGSAIVKILRGACLAAIPLLLATGLIPMYMGEVCMLRGIHWAILGVAGALVAVLRALGGTNRLVVGNEQGVKEVQRAWWGAGLGLVAGLLTYMLVRSGFFANFLFSGSYSPGDFENQHITVSGCFLEHIHQGQIYVHMLLAFLAGYAFERVIDRVRAAAAS